MKSRQGPRSASQPPAEAESPQDRGEPTPSVSVDLAGQQDRRATMDDSQVRREILRLVRQLVKAQELEEFSLTKLIGGVVQVFALLSLLLTFWKLLGPAPIEHALLWATATVALQVMSLTFFMMHQRK